MCDCLMCNVLRRERDEHWDGEVSAIVEANRLRGMVNYALDGPPENVVLLLKDALDGCHGETDYRDIRSARERAEADALIQHDRAEAQLARATRLEKAHKGAMGRLAQAIGETRKAEARVAFLEGLLRLGAEPFCGNEAAIEAVMEALRRRAGLDGAERMFDCCNCGKTFRVSDGIVPIEDCRYVAREARCPSCAGLDKQETAHTHDIGPNGEVGPPKPEPATTPTLRARFLHPFPAGSLGACFDTDSAHAPCPQCATFHQKGEPCPPQAAAAERDKWFKGKQWGQVPTDSCDTCTGLRAQPPKEDAT